MDQITLTRERRRQLALERLGSHCPSCPCGEKNWRCLQLKPNPMVANGGSCTIICRNCRCKQRSNSKICQSNADRACLICTEADSRCLELHHIAGRAYADDCVVVCSNCHTKLSEMQKDHSMSKATDHRLECIRRFLLGLADLFELVIPKLREFARHLNTSKRTQEG